MLSISTSDVAKFDLSLLLSEHTDDTGAQTGISAEFTYASALFDEDTVEVFARRFVRILRAAGLDATAPGRRSARFSATRNTTG